MFSSIRTRLTLWYLGVLAFIVITFAVATYIVVARNLGRTTDNNLAEISRTVEADLRKEDADVALERLALTRPVEEEGEDEEKAQNELDETALTIETAIAEELEDQRSREYGFTVLDQKGLTVATTVTGPKLEEDSKNLAADVPFADVSVGAETFRVHQTSLNLDGKRFNVKPNCRLGIVQGMVKWFDMKR